MRHAKLSKHRGRIPREGLFPYLVLEPVSTRQLPSPRSPDRNPFQERSDPYLHARIRALLRDYPLSGKPNQVSHYVRHFEACALSVGSPNRPARLDRLASTPCQSSVGRLGDAKREFFRDRRRCRRNVVPAMTLEDSSLVQCHRIVYCGPALLGNAPAALSFLSSCFSDCAPVGGIAALVQESFVGDRRKAGMLAALVA